ncbi:MAG TPA: hypothetical protein GXX14_07055 [Clostridiaceae bacterium]|nr:hypothetical protein [Clostridiaceae bacterium]
MAEGKTGRTLNFSSHMLPDELVCIQAPIVLHQLSVRKNITRNIALTPKPDLLHPFFSFECIKNFHISNIKILSKTVINKDAALKKNYELSISTIYNLAYSDGNNQLLQPDESIFNLTLNNICCPRFRLKCYPKEYPCVFPTAIDEDGTIIEVDALAKDLWNMLCPCTGALIIEIGVLFFIKFVCYKQIVVPSYTKFPPVPRHEDTEQQKLKEGG